MKKIIILLISIFLFTSCSQKELEEENKNLKKQVTELKQMMTKMDESYERLLILASKMKDVKARIVTNMGNIEINFFPEKAPLQCFNFITRAESGYYDNTLFHRVVKGFMIQGGDPLSKTDKVELYGTGNPLVNIPHEFNETKHKRGILSTARRSNINEGAGSQFFIMHADNANLDGQYTVFGEVSKGMDIVDKIANVQVVPNVNRPVKPVKIITIEVFK